MRPSTYYEGPPCERPEDVENGSDGTSRRIVVDVFVERGYAIMVDALRNESLEYHRGGRPGKIEVVSTKPCATQKDLSLAYTPGVAEPCLAIEKNPDLAYEYTAKGNLVAVITNGTARSSRSRLLVRPGVEAALRLHPQ